MNPIVLALGGLRATAFAGLALVLAIALGVQTVRLSSARETLAEEKLATVSAKVEAEKAAREREREHAQEFAAIAGRLVTENEDAKAQTDRLLAGLRDGTERLRRRFQCPATLGVPADPAAASGSDGAAATGLLAEDAVVLVREAERADAIVRQLTACQTTLQKVVAASQQVPK